ncbi:MAG: hypothetical protein WA957_10160, partial [Alteraurantiacibacter sp.]
VYDFETHRETIMPLFSAFIFLFSVASHMPVAPPVKTEAATPSQTSQAETTPEARVLLVSCNPSIQRCY